VIIQTGLVTRALIFIARTRAAGQSWRIFVIGRTGKDVVKFPDMVTARSDMHG